MDTVKNVKSKEDDFLFDMLNECLRDRKYRWVPELYNFKMEKGDNINWDLIQLNEDLDFLYQLEFQNYYKQYLILNSDNNNFEFIDKLDFKQIMDFKEIENIEQLNLKLGRDVHVMKCLIK